jgi:hypothetical protein
VKSTVINRQQKFNSHFWRWNRVNAPPGAGRDLLIVSGIWVTSLLLVWPVGNFPLNDDWAFARTVKHLLDTGSYNPTPWAAMPLLAHTLWGALFCLPAGFSFNALRASTLVMSAAGIVITYRMLRSVHPSRWVAIFGALTVALNPIYFALSCTFMTDVTFTTLMLGSAFFFLRNLRGGCGWDLLAGVLLALAATLSRQVGLATPIAFAICLLWTKGYRRGSWAQAIAPVIVCIGGLLLYQFWMKTTGRLPFAYDKMNLRVGWVFSDPWLLMIEIKKHLGPAALYLGLFSLPVSVFILPRFNLGRGRLRSLVAAAAGMTAFIFCFAADVTYRRLSMPILGNIIVPQGIGPLTLNDAMVTEASYSPTLGHAFWFGVTVLAVLGGALLVGGAIGYFSCSWRSYVRRTLRIEVVPGVFFLLSTAAYLFTILAVGGWDRYLLPAVPLLLTGGAALAGSLPREQSAECANPTPWPHLFLATSLLGLFAFFSICGTHDYLSWNRARWKLLAELLASGKTSPENVDGGFEFNGWLLYDPAYKARRGTNWWWVHGDDFLVAFGDQAGYRRIKEYPYSNWMPRRRRSVLLLAREGTAARNLDKSVTERPSPAQ